MLLPPSTPWPLLLLAALHPLLPASAFPGGGCSRRDLDENDGYSACLDDAFYSDAFAAVQEMRDDQADGVWVSRQEYQVKILGSDLIPGGWEKSLEKCCTESGF